MDIFRNGDDPFLEYVRTTYCTRGNKPDVEVVIRKLSLDADDGETTAAYIQTAYNAGKGHFCQLHQNRKGSSIQYFCERHSKPKGKKSGAPNTRANNCPAYISFRYVTHMCKKAVIIRRKLNHTGHDPTDISEKRVALLDPELLCHIECLVDQGKRPFKIITACSKWSKERGHTDYRDRRFYPTHTDIKNVVASFKAKTRLHNEDSVAVDILCTDILKDNIVFYQALNEANAEPLIIVYQNDKQFHRMVEYGQRVVFLDATYKGITSYSYAFYCLVARDETGHGTPLLYIISSADSKQVLTLALKKVKDLAKEKGVTFYPRSFMVDKDIKEETAITAVFPNSQVLLCWFHVIQAVYRWLNKHGSGVSGANHAIERKQVVDYIRKMKHCAKEEDFTTLANNLKSVMPSPEVAKYIKDNWVPKGRMWSNFGRRFFHEDHETNNLVERFFLSLKYHHLGGQTNQRVDSLLLLLDKDVESFYEYMEELSKVGRIPKEKSRIEERSKQLAEGMLQQNWGQKLTWITDTKCKVPSQNDLTRTYTVDLIHSTCECVGAAQHGMCKHFHVVSILAISRDTDILQCRALRAKELYSKSSYSVDGKTLEVVDHIDNHIGIVNLDDFRCLCIAYSHGVNCVCTQVASLVFPKMDSTNDTSLSIVDTDISEKDDTVSQMSTVRQKIKDKIKDISRWVEDIEFQEDTQVSRVHRYVNQLHRVIFSHHINVNRKRRQSPLHPWRSIKKRKTARTGSDHAYATSQTMKVKPNKMQRKDGGFKMTNRGKAGQRVPFKK